MKGAEDTAGEDWPEGHGRRTTSSYRREWGLSRHRAGFSTGLSREKAAMAFSVGQCRQWDGRGMARDEVTPGRKSPYLTEPPVLTFWLSTVPKHSTVSAQGRRYHPRSPPSEQSSVTLILHLVVAHRHLPLLPLSDHLPKQAEGLALLGHQHSTS